MAASLRVPGRGWPHHAEPLTRRLAASNAAPLLLRGGAVLLVLLLAGCAAIGGLRPGAAAKPTREVLPNGVVLIVQEHRASDVVALQLWVRMGGRVEAADDSGLRPHIH